MLQILKAAVMIILRAQKSWIPLLLIFIIICMTKSFIIRLFRSAATGYSFNDLYNMYKEELNYNIPELYSKIF